jgi:hypothetical protein
MRLKLVHLASERPSIQREKPRFFPRMSFVLLIAGFLWAVCRPALADPTYIGASGPTHSWASGWFEEADYHSPGVFDEMKMEIDTGKTSATFENGTSEFSPGWEFTNTPTSLTANYDSPAGTNMMFFDLVFNDPPPPFVGIYVQFLEGNQIVESGYFYRGSGEDVPGGHSAGGGWGFTTDWQMPVPQPDGSGGDSQSVPEPSAWIALLGLLATGLLIGGRRWRSKHRRAASVGLINGIHLPRQVPNC